MTNDEIRKALDALIEQNHNLAHEEIDPTIPDYSESVIYAGFIFKLAIALRDRIIAADNLAEAAAAVVTEQGDPAYRHEPDPIKSELRFWKLRGALREYRGEKGGGE